MTSLPNYGVLLTPKYGQKRRVTQNLRNFLIHIARRCESTAESDQPHSFLARLPLWQSSFTSLGYLQTDTKLLPNNSQHCWMLHVASVCTPCCMLLGVVEKSLKPVKLIATCKRTQQLPIMLRVIG